MERLSIEEIIEHCKRKRETFEKVNGVEMLENKDISDTFIREYWEHRQVAEYLSELQQYRSIGTVEECRAAVEKQREKKYKTIEPCKSVTYYQCPCCNGLLHINENFCGECGQAILWEEEND